MKDDVPSQQANSVADDEPWHLDAPRKFVRGTYQGGHQCQDSGQPIGCVG